MILYDKRIHALKAFFEQMPSKFAPAKQYVSSCILHRKLNQNHIFLQKKCIYIFLILTILLVAWRAHSWIGVKNDTFI